jgi:hypothetical protein
MPDNASVLVPEKETVPGEMIELPSGGTVKRDTGGVISQRMDSGSLEMVFPALSVALREIVWIPSVRETVLLQLPSMQIDSEAIPEVVSIAPGLRDASDTNQPSDPFGAERLAKEGGLRST